MPISLIFQYHPAPGNLILKVYYIYFSDLFNFPALLKSFAHLEFHLIHSFYYFNLLHFEMCNVTSCRWNHLNLDLYIQRLFGICYYYYSILNLILLNGFNLNCFNFNQICYQVPYSSYFIICNLIIYYFKFPKVF